jgi:hypothetical protein
MRLNKIFLLLAVVTLVLGASAPASAQGSVSFGFSNFGRCGSGFGLGFTVPLCQRCWVPGYYEIRYADVWVPGPSRQVWVEPVYDTCRDPCGNTTRVIVRAGYYQWVQDPGHYETREIRVWVPGHYQ